MEKNNQVLRETKSKETFFLFVKSSVGNLKIHNETIICMCENVQAQNTATCYWRTKQYVQVELSSLERPPTGVIPARMSAIAVKADGEEVVVVQDVIDKAQIWNKSKS